MLKRRKHLAYLLIFALILTTVLSALPTMAAGVEKADVIIAFKNQPGPSEAALLKGLGGTVKHTYHIVPAMAASLPQAAIDALSKNPKVLRIEPDVEAFALADAYPWGITKIGANSVQAGGNTGNGVKVAIIDSGVDYTHPDLAGRYKGGWDYVNNDSDPMDDNGHGTHVAGTVAAVINNEGIIGVAPEVDIYALKVLNSSGSGSFSNIIKAVEWCVDNGIQITNNSYGSSGDPGTTVKLAFDNAYASGVLHVAAAGNSGRANGTGDNVGYPAKYASVVAVAATDSKDARGSFSSTGPAVELAAPGVSILSTVPGGGYATWNGTSMASPHAAGAAALVIASGVTGPDSIRIRLQETAKDLGTAGRDSWYGYGLVDTLKATEAATPPPANTAPTVTITSPADGFTTTAGTSVSFSGTATDAEDGTLTGTLTWTSSIEGPIGTGGTFSRALTEGTHTITASASDSGGLSSQASITVTVTAQDDQTQSVSVKSVDYKTEGGKNSSAHLVVTVNLENSLAQPVSGAVVAFTLYKDGKAYATASGTTDAAGKVVYKAANAKAGTYSTIVTGITSGLTWDGTTPDNQFVKK